jgi:hypothetical protein
MLTGGDTFYTLTPEKDRPDATHLALAPAPDHLGEGEATAEMGIRVEGDTLMFDVPLPERGVVTFAMHMDTLHQVLEATCSDGGADD